MYVCYLINKKTLSKRLFALSTIPIDLCMDTATYQISGEKSTVISLLRKLGPPVIGEVHKKAERAVDRHKQKEKNKFHCFHGQKLYILFMICL